MLCHRNSEKASVASVCASGGRLVCNEFGEVGGADQFHCLSWSLFASADLYQSGFYQRNTTSRMCMCTHTYMYLSFYI